MDSVTTLIYSATWLAGVAITYVIFCLYVAFMRSRWATYFTWAISPDVPPIVAGTCHPWAVHRTQNKHTFCKYLCSSFLVLWFVIAMKDEIFLKTKIFFIAPTWPQSEAAPWTETSTDSLSTRWKSTREVFTTTPILCSKAVYFNLSLCISTLHDSFGLFSSSSLHFNFFWHCRPLQLHSATIIAQLRSMARSQGPLSFLYIGICLSSFLHFRIQVTL